MARALLGHLGSSGTEQTLYFEVLRLRRRVAELETEISELRSDRHSEINGHTELDTVLDLHDLELQHLADDAAPALT